MTNSLEKELVVFMKLTAKVNDVNDVFADISVIPATIISTIATCSYICMIWFLDLNKVMSFSVGYIKKVSKGQSTDLYRLLIFIPEI